VYYTRDARTPDYVETYSLEVDCCSD